MTKPLSGNQGLAFQPHALQIVLFGPFTYEPTIMCGSLQIVSLQLNRWKIELKLFFFEGEIELKLK